LGNGADRGLPLWSRTIVIGMAIRGLYVPTSGPLNFAFLCPRGPPPCDPRELMAAVPRAHRLLQYQPLRQSRVSREFAPRDELVFSTGRNVTVVNCTVRNIYAWSLRSRWIVSFPTAALDFNMRIFYESAEYVTYLFTELKLTLRSKYCK